MCVYVLFPSSTSSTYIALQPLGVFDQTLCILKHVEDVQDNLRHLQHALIYTVFDGMVGKSQLSKTFFRLKIH